MNYLKKEESIKLTDGRTAVVRNLLGEGAQGVVYKVDVNGEEKAMKWYKKMPPKTFVQNLQKNIKMHAPSPVFLWPEAIAKEAADGVGYIMPLKSPDCYEFSKFRMTKVRFSSFRAIIEVAMKLCDAFKLLHANGLSYQDLNDGGFFINPVTGDVAVCDCDNVFPHGENSGILGKARYMAPEVVLGKTLPNSYSDRFSLSVILFMLFCLDHPFEGFNVVKHPCLTEAIEQRLFGKDICFIFDPHNACNRPVRGIHRNVLTIWPLLPQVLKDAFTSEFSRSKLDNPPERMTEMQWIDIFMSLSDHLVKCPNCGDEVFAYEGMGCLNSRCRQKVDVKYRLEGGGRSIPLLKGSVVRDGRDRTVAAIAVEKPGDSRTLLLKNLSKQTWCVTTPTGKSVSVVSNGFMPVKPNLTISLTYKMTIKD